MKRLLVAVAFSLVAFEASGFDPLRHRQHDLRGVQALVKTDGSAILRYHSTRNFSLPLYDTYVNGQQSCKNDAVALRTGVPTTDKKYCPVYKCVESNIFVSH